MRISPESRKFLLVESGIQALGIGIQLKEPEILFKIEIRNPSSTDKQTGILDRINFTWGES